MGWGDVFRAFFSTCFLGVVVFVVVQCWKAIRRMRRETEALTPEQRRENWRVALGTIAGLVVGVAVIYAAYRWGESEWGARTGAAMAIGAFVIAVIFAFLGMALLGIRDARRDRAQRSTRL